MKRFLFNVLLAIIVFCLVPRHWASTHVLATTIIVASAFLVGPFLYRRDIVRDNLRKFRQLSAYALYDNSDWSWGWAFASYVGFCIGMGYVGSVYGKALHGWSYNWRAAIAGTIAEIALLAIYTLIFASYILYREDGEVGSIPEHKRGLGDPLALILSWPVVIVPVIVCIVGGIVGFLQMLQAAWRVIRDTVVPSLRHACVRTLKMPEDASTTRFAMMATLLIGLLMLAIGWRFVRVVAGTCAFIVLGVFYLALSAIAFLLEPTKNRLVIACVWIAAGTTWAYAHHRVPAIFALGALAASGLHLLIGPRVTPHLHQHAIDKVGALIGKITDANDAPSTAPPPAP